MPVPVPAASVAGAIRDRLGYQPWVGEAFVLTN
jgi:hypothetical protein